MSGGLRKRYSNPHVRVPRPTVRDTEISYRALGVLAWILDRPDGWDIRAEQMANDGKRTDGTGPSGKPHRREGREAIRTELRELGESGYYRLERRRMRTGQIAMGTAVSDEPVTSWAEQWKAFKGGAVSVVEQTDGSFLVRYPDGSLLPDDCPPPEMPPPADEDVSAGHTGDGFPGPGDSTGDGIPGPGLAESGEPGPGKASPLEEEVRAVGKENPPLPPQAGGAPGETSKSPNEPGRCVEHNRLACRACGHTPRQRQTHARLEADLARTAVHRRRPWCQRCSAPTDRLVIDPTTGRVTNRPCPTCSADRLAVAT